MNFSSITEYLRNYGNSLWVAWNALFIQTYHFKNLHRWEYLSIIGVLLVTKVFVLTLFSSQILSITIDNPYVVIDSLDELMARPDLEPLLFSKEANIAKFKRDKSLRPLIDRVMANNGYLGHNQQKLYSGQLNQIFENISIKASHVLLASEWDSELLVGLNEDKYKKTTHLAHNKYFDKITGVVYRKDIPTILVDVIQQLIYTIHETGLRRKMAIKSVQVVYAMFGDGQHMISEKETKDYMELDEMKIALGPYLLAMSLASAILVIERWIHYKPNKSKDQKSANVEKWATKRRHKPIVVYQ